jgi:CRP-like cAMP-binding protein
MFSEWSTKLTTRNNGFDFEFQSLNFVKLAPRQKFLSGQYLCRQNEVGECSFVILSGQVQLKVEDTRSRMSYSNVSVRGEGEIIGELSLFGDFRCADAQAISEVECVRIPHAVLLHLIATEPSISLCLLNHVMRKIRGK